MKKAVMCVADTQVQAENIVSALQAAGIPNSDISVVLPDTRGGETLAHEKHSKAPEGAVTGAGTGGVLGGTLGLLAGVGALAIPGVGPFIAAGPLLAALSGAAIGAGVGGVTGSLIGLGIPEIEAKWYSGKLRDGNVLVSVHVSDAETRKRAEEILSKSGAHHVSTANEHERDARL